MVGMNSHAGGLDENCPDSRDDPHRHYCNYEKVKISSRKGREMDLKRCSQRARTNTYVVQILVLETFRKEHQVRSHFGSSRSTSLSGQRAACEPIAKDSVKQPNSGLSHILFPSHTLSVSIMGMPPSWTSTQWVLEDNRWRWNCRKCQKKHGTDAELPL